MSRRFYIKKSYFYTLDECIEVCVKYKNTIIFNTNKKRKIPTEIGILEAQVLELISTTYMEDYNSGNDALSKCRPEFLVIQNIISFFGGIPLTVYDEIDSSFHIRDNYNYNSISKSKNIKLIIGRNDYTSQLSELLKQLEGNNDKLIISLLDRWRKANYLKNRSYDSNLYHDEAILSYFHIIELFAENIKNEFKDKLDRNMEQLLERYYKKNLFCTGNQIINKIQYSKKIIGEILIEKELSLAQKIKYFLKKYDLLDENVSNFIDSAIKIRNSIAHGRITYKEKVIYPLPPFFCLTSNSYDILKLLEFLTGRMISSYIGIECWKEEWEESKTFLLPPTDILSNFLEDISKFNNINCQSLFEGNEYNITWRTIFGHYVGNNKKFNINRLANSLKEYFINTTVTKDNCIDLLNISVILSDCDNKEVKDKAIKNIKYLISENLVSRSKLKDLNNYLDYYNLSSDWFKKYLFQ